MGQPGGNQSYRESAGGGNVHCRSKIWGFLLILLPSLALSQEKCLCGSEIAKRRKNVLWVTTCDNDRNLLQIIESPLQKLHTTYIVLYGIKMLIKLTDHLGSNMGPSESDHKSRIRHINSKVRLKKWDRQKIDPI